LESNLARLGMILASLTINPGPLVVDCRGRSSGKSQVRRRGVLNKFASYFAKLRWVFAMKNPLFSLEQESSQARRLSPISHESLRSVTGVAIACEAPSSLLRTFHKLLSLLPFTQQFFVSSLSTATHLFDYLLIASTPQPDPFSRRRRRWANPCFFSSTTSRMAWRSQWVTC